MSIPVRVNPAIRAHVARSGFEIAADHPLADQDCPVCDLPLTDGPVSLVYVGRSPEDRGGWTAASVPVHDACTDVSLP